MYIDLSFAVLICSVVLSEAAPANILSGLKEKRVNNGVGITPAMGFNNWNSGLS